MSDQQTRTPDDDAREARIGRILDDFLTRRARGEKVTEADLLAEHSDLADDLREHLELLGELRPTTATIDALIAQGLLTRSEDPRYLAELDAYKILSLVGRGGMGVVLRAYEESLNRTVALKILRPELAGDGIALERFTREAKAAAALRHPNIVTMHAIGEHHGVHFLAMEYVDGPSLANVILESYQPSAVSHQPARTESPISNRQSPIPNLQSPIVNRQSSISDPQSPIPNRQSSIRDPETVRHIFRQLLEALAAAHEAGLIHRDVKSSNILLDGWPSSEPQSDEATKPRSESVASGLRAGREDVASGLRAGREDVASGLRAGRGNVAAGPRTGRENVAAQPSTGRAADDVPTPQRSIPNRQSSIVKLADFGLARMITAQTRVTLGDSILGTPEYMSPEQARGDEDIDHRADLYSVGVVLYEMLTGRTPFRADTPSAVIHQILNVDPPEPRTFNRDVDPALASLSLRLMAKEPDDRFASVGEAVLALESRREARSSARGSRFRYVVGAVLIALGLLVVTRWFLPQPGARAPAPGGQREAASTEPATLRTTRRPLAPGPRIVDVRVDEDYSHIVGAVYDDETKKVFHKFPEEVGPVWPKLVDLNEPAAQVVVVGLKNPLADSTMVTIGGEPVGTANLLAFNGGKELLWGLYLHDETKKFWPESYMPAHWVCTVFSAGDLDGKPGVEIVATAHDRRDSPTRLSVIDTLTGKIRSTYWHYGHLTGVRVVPRFFGSKRPGVIAWGVNEKLPGQQRGDRWPTEWNMVSVVMILDPNEMDGVGPTRPARLPGVQPVRPHAYAYLDLSHSSVLVETSAGDYTRSPPEEETALIAWIEGEPCAAADGTDPWFAIKICCSNSGIGRCTLVVDRDLGLRKVDLDTRESQLRVSDKGFWHDHWRQYKEED